MNKVCRIVESKNINRRKYIELEKQAHLLGTLRKEIWQRFGSINGVGTNHRTIRSDWVKIRDFKPLAAKAWKETLRDTLDDIKLYEEAAKEKVRKDIRKSKKSDCEKKELYKKLKSNVWVSNSYLCRKMRKYKKHGKTSIKNQIIVENGVYKQFQGKDGNTWLKIPSLQRGKMLCIPLSSKIQIKGCLRIILKEGTVYIHHTIKQRNLNHAEILLLV